MHRIKNVIAARQRIERCDEKAFSDIETIRNYIIPNVTIFTFMKLIWN